jgi:hypothetical protein
MQGVRQFSIKIARMQLVFDQAAGGQMCASDPHRKEQTLSLMQRELRNDGRMELTFSLGYGDRKRWDQRGSYDDQPNMLLATRNHHSSIVWHEEHLAG